MDEHEVERVTVVLPTCYADEIRTAVATGEYPSPDAAVEKAVGDW